MKKICLILIPALLCTIGCSRRFSRGRRSSSNNDPSYSYSYNYGFGSSKTSSSSNKSSYAPSQSSSESPRSSMWSETYYSESSSRTNDTSSSSSRRKPSSSSQSFDQYYQVTIDYGDGNPIEQTILHGDPITRPNNPNVPAGKVFYGWVNVRNGGQIWDFEDEWLNAVYDDVILEPLFIDSSSVLTRVEAELAPAITEYDGGRGMDGATYSGGQKGKGLICKAYEGDFNIEPMYINDWRYDQARYATSSDPSDEIYGAFVHFHYVKGNKFTYIVESSADVDNAVMFMKIASEYGEERIDTGDTECKFNDAMFPVKVNGTALQYGTIIVHGIDQRNIMPFQDYLLSTKVSLKAGTNTIEMEIDNDVCLFGTIGSTAPMIDCLKIYAPSALTVTNAKLANLDYD